MGLHRRLAEVQRGGDLGVRQAPRHVDQHLALALGELLEPGRRTARRRAVGPADEVGDEPAGDRRRQERLAGGDDPHGGDQLLGRRVLEQEPAGTCPQRVVDVLVEVEGGEHQHLRGLLRLGPGQAPGRLDPVEVRHADVHEDDVGHRLPVALERLDAVGRLGDDLQVGLGVEDHAEAGADECLVVHHEEPDHVAASTGMRAHTAKPPPDRSPTFSSPP